MLSWKKKSPRRPPFARVSCEVKAEQLLAEVAASISLCHQQLFHIHTGETSSRHLCVRAAAPCFRLVDSACCDPSGEGRVSQYRAGVFTPTMLQYSALWNDFSRTCMHPPSHFFFQRVPFIWSFQMKFGLFAFSHQVSDLFLCSKKMSADFSTHHLFSSFLPPASGSQCVWVMISGWLSLADVSPSVFNWMLPPRFIHIKIWYCLSVFTCLIVHPLVLTVRSLFFFLLSAGIFISPCQHSVSSSSPATNAYRSVSPHVTSSCT